MILLQGGLGGQLGRSFTVRRYKVYRAVFVRECGEEWRTARFSIPLGRMSRGISKVRRQT